MAAWRRFSASSCFLISFSGACLLSRATLLLFLCFVPLRFGAGSLLCNKCIFCLVFQLDVDVETDVAQQFYNIGFGLKESYQVGGFGGEGTDSRDYRNPRRVV